MNKSYDEILARSMGKSVDEARTWLHKYTNPIISLEEIRSINKGENWLELDKRKLKNKRHTYANTSA